MQPDFQPHRKALLVSLMASAFLVTACGGGGGGQAADPGADAADVVDGTESALALRRWTKIAGEGGSFAVSNLSTVRFGTGSSWVKKSVIGAGVCNVEFFGSDPAVGQAKE